jgi:hypothetical protein
LEVTCGSVGVVRPNGGQEEGEQGEGDLSALRAGRVLHTNHYLHEQLAHLNSQYPEIIQSVPRLGRANLLADELEASNAGGGGGGGGGTCPLCVSDLQALFRDHEGKPRSICRHPNTDEDTGEWITVRS